MSAAPKFIVQPICEAAGPACWGLFSIGEDRWLDVVFKSRREADEACAVLAGRDDTDRIRFGRRGA